MNERKKVEEKLRKKEQEIQYLEEQIKAARVYIQALQDVLKMLSRSSEAVTLRPGSTVAQAREIIIRSNQPVHINAILESLGKDMTREARASLTSSLAAYARKGEVFSRTAPNTYGLIELGHRQNIYEKFEPPSDFGRLSSAPQPNVPPEAKDDDPF